MNSNSKLYISCFFQLITLQYFLLIFIAFTWQIKNGQFAQQVAECLFTSDFQQLIPNYDTAQHLLLNLLSA